MRFYITIYCVSHDYRGITNVRMYVRTYVCMYVRTYVCMYVCMHVCTVCTIVHMYMYGIMQKVNELHM